MASDARKLASLLESAAGLMEQMQSVVERPGAPAASDGFVGQRNEALRQLKEARASARRSWLSGAYCDDSAPFGSEVPVPTSMEEAEASLTTAKQVAEAEQTSAKAAASKQEIAFAASTIEDSILGDDDLDL